MKKLNKIILQNKNIDYSQNPGSKPGFYNDTRS